MQSVPAIHSVLAGHSGLALGKNIVAGKGQNIVSAVMDFAVPLFGHSSTKVSSDESMMGLVHVNEAKVH